MAIINARRRRPPLIRASRVASVDFVIWKTRFYRNNVGGSGYSEVLYDRRLEAGAFRGTNSQLMASEAFAVPVLVLVNGSRVVMEGIDILDGVYYSGINATGAQVAEDSGIEISASWNAQSRPSQYTPSGPNKLTYVDGILGPGNNSFLTNRDPSSRTTLEGRRDMLSIDASSDWSGNSNGEGMFSQIIINSIRNTFTNANIPFSFSVASGVSLYRGGSSGTSNTWLEYENF